MQEPSVSSGAIEVGLLLRIFVPFFLGAIITLLLTSVNHRRDHIKHVREILSKSVKGVSESGVSFWANSYAENNMVQLRAAITYMQHTLPYALESTRVPKENSDEMNELFVKILHEALYVDGEFDKGSHKIDIQRVTRLLVLCASAEALSNRLLLQRMSFFALSTDWIPVIGDKIIRGLKSAHNTLLVP